MFVTFQLLLSQIENIDSLEFEIMMSHYLLHDVVPFCFDVWNMKNIQKINSRFTWLVKCIHLYTHIIILFCFLNVFCVVCHLLLIQVVK